MPNEQRARIYTSIYIYTQMDIWTSWNVILILFSRSCSLETSFWDDPLIKWSKNPKLSRFSFLDILFGEQEKSRRMREMSLGACAKNWLWMEQCYTTGITVFKITTSCAWTISARHRLIGLRMKALFSTISRVTEDMNHSDRRWIHKYRWWLLFWLAFLVVMVELAVNERHVIGRKGSITRQTWNWFLFWQTKNLGDILNKEWNYICHGWWQWSVSSTDIFDRFSTNQTVFAPEK